MPIRGYLCEVATCDSATAQTNCCDVTCVNMRLDAYHDQPCTPSTYGDMFRIWLKTIVADAATLEKQLVHLWVHQYYSL